jgi:hypothetical protein
MRARQRATIGARFVELFDGGAGLADPAAPPTGRPLAGGLTAPVVRLRGLPLGATPGKVVAFLGEEAKPRGGAAGVVFTATPDGRPTGEAYVEFEEGEAGEASAAAALARHGSPFAARYVEAFVSCRGDLLHAARARGTCPPPGADGEGGEGGATAAAPPPAPAPPRDPTVLRLRGLPYTATAGDVATFFEGFDVAPGGVTIVPRVARSLTPFGTAEPTTGDGAPCGSGIAYVRFSSADEAARARAARHRATLGARFVECLPSMPPRSRARPARGSGPGPPVNGVPVAPAMVAAAAAAAAATAAASPAAGWPHHPHAHVHFLAAAAAMRVSGLHHHPAYGFAPPPGAVPAAWPPGAAGARAAAAWARYARPPPPGARQPVAIMERGPAPQPPAAGGA